MRISLVALGVGLALCVVGCSKRETRVSAPVASSSLHKGVAVLARAPVIAPPEAPASDGKNLDQFMHVVHDAGRDLVVLSRDVSDAWIAGEPDAFGFEGLYTVQRAVAAAALPSDLARRAGMHVKLFGASGVVCQGVLGPLELVGRVTPHFAEISEWEGTAHEMGLPDAPLPPEEVAKRAWDLTEGGRMLVAEVISTTGKCDSGDFARAAALPTPAIVKAESVPPALLDKAFSALRDLPAYEENARQYHASSAGSGGTGQGSWVDADSSKLFRGKRGTYLWISSAGGERCSDFNAQLATLWKVEKPESPTPTFTLVYEGADVDASEIDPSEAADLDGDGVPELLGAESVMFGRPSGYALDRIHVPNLDCGC
jgi:hypothetical protein